MIMLRGFQVKGDKVCRLMKSLYGLEQGPRHWNHKLTAALINLNFQQSQHYYSLFIRRNSEGITIILLYVDDMPIIYSSLKLVEGTTKALLSFFKIKYLGELQYILGNEFTRSKKGITL